MTKYKRNRIAKYVLRKQLEQQYLCNFCGETCVMNANNIYKDICGLINCSVFGAFASDLLDDETSYTFSLCEFCLEHLFSLFNIPPNVKHSDVRLSYKSALFKNSINSRIKEEYLHRNGLRTK